MEENKTIIEALIFASDNPLSADRVAEIIPDVKKDEINRLIRELMREYEERRSGLYIQEVAGGFQFRSRESLGSWINRMKGGKSLMLSPAAMETLAVVAYRQPVVKAEIDRVRGVDVSGSLRGLLEKKYVRIMGRKDVPGKPIIYGTTKKFLEVFNLKDLSELPTLRELKDLKNGT
ncbi:MAG: SMC-Scp complex subunit ScpB [Deltaproteobacteria bacterium]|nr:SMC-Scp complex subunit ScpB [Deltaproteobacteria bacterium]